MTESAHTRDSLILPSVEDNVGTITLHRPEALNAFNLEMAQEILRTLTEFSQDAAVRAIVLRGAGKVFSAGGDIKEMWEDVLQGDDPAAYFRAPLTAFGEIVLSVWRMPKPVLAAVHGAVAGVAFNLMLACDLKIATATTRFTQAFIKIGLSPDGGGTWLLPRLAGRARAAELALLPTELDAATAREWGLINWVVAEADFAARVKGITAQLAAGPVAAMGRAKELLNSACDTGLADHIEAERLAQVANAASPDFAEGLAAFLERRRPSFGG
jgi:2-(1,2-epoxy-1,2-dihydrophenyl)acetyl-CoA isomerase